jgi:hypothetical protein
MLDASGDSIVKFMCIMCIIIGQQIDGDSSVVTFLSYVKHLFQGHGIHQDRRKNWK